MGTGRHPHALVDAAGSTATRRPSSPTVELREANAARGRDEREYELADTGVLDGNRFFDVTTTYAKAAPDDVCHRDRGDQPRSRCGTAAPAAPDLVPQHLGLGPRRPHPERWRRFGPAPTWPSATSARRRLPARLPGPLRAQRAFADRSRTCRSWCATTRPTTSRLFGSAAHTRTPFTKDGINATVVVHGDASATHAGGTRGPRPRSGTASTVDRCRARPSGSELRLSPRRPRAEQTFGPGLRRPWSLTGAGRGRHVLRRRRSPPGASADDRAHRPARVRRPALGQAALPLHRATTGSTATRATPTAAGEPQSAGRPGATSSWAAPGPGRRDLHARRVGISVVRGLGPGLPLRQPWPTSTRPSSPRTSSLLHVPRVGHAPRRPTARVRMVLRRRQPAGARLGRLARVRGGRRPTIT